MWLPGCANSWSWTVLHHFLARSFFPHSCRVVLPLPKSLGSQQLDVLFFFFWEADLTVVSYGILYMKRNSKDIFSNVSSVSSLLMFAFFHPQEATVFFWSLIVWQSVCLVRLVRILFLGRLESWHKYSLFSRRAICFSISPRWKRMPFYFIRKLGLLPFPLLSPNKCFGHWNYHAAHEVVSLPNILSDYSKRLGKLGITEYIFFSTNTFPFHTFFFHK